MRLHLMLCAGLLIGLEACQPSTENTPQPYDSGVVVTNEGGFGKGNGSVSFLNRNTNIAALDIFKTENGVSLGDVVQSYTENGEKGFVVVNNSNKVEVVNTRTFKRIATLTNRLTLPRYALAQDNRLYVTCWDNFNPDFSFKTGWLAVVDLTTGQTLKTIPLGKGPEKLLLLGNDLYVSNSGDNSVSVISLATETLAQNIQVGNAPNDIFADANGKIWVLCRGKSSDKSEMIRLNPTTKSIENRLTVGTHPQKKAASVALSADRQTVYFTYNFYDAADGFKYKGEVYSFRISDSSIPASTPIAQKPFYGLGLDPKTGLLYGALVPSFTQSGYVFRYQPTGILQDSVKVEIAPNGFFFK
jgi:YVTN family beta-propeller protein